MTAKDATPDKLVRWMIAFSQVEAGDLGRGRPGDLLNHLYDLREFLGVEEGDDEIERTLGKAQKEPAVLAPAITILRELLGAVADHRPFRYRFQSGTLMLDTRKAGTGRMLSYHSPSLGDAVAQVGADCLAADYLGDALVGRVRRCANDLCGRIFFAERKSQIYCGHKCANLVASRTYREQNREKRARHAREKYRQKIQAKAPGIRVGRG
jgi:predicted RNA-binding Zn ribbon-like protein